MNTLDIRAILERLPLRYPMLLIDQVLDYHPHRSIRAVKNVSYNEQFFSGHFPNRPLLPGVIVLEALAQAASLLWALSEPAEAGSNLVGFDKARFRKPVLPGDQLLLSAHFERSLKGMRRFSTAALVGPDQVASAQIMLIAEAPDPT